MRHLTNCPVPFVPSKSATFVGQNAWHIPSSLTFRYAGRIRRLDLSFNCLQTLAGIEFFNCLEELVLDNNLLDDSIRFFYNPMMRILSINKNKVRALFPLKFKAQIGH